MDGRALVGPRPRSREFIPVYSGLRIRNIDNYEIIYGGMLSDFELDGERVRSIQTEKEVLFIRPKASFLLEFGRDYTCRILRELGGHGSSGAGRSMRAAPPAPGSSAREELTAMLIRAGVSIPAGSGSCK
jgi:hypothetical protein